MPLSCGSWEWRGDPASYESELMAIRNIVFDIGGVLIGWDPPGIVERTFGEADVPRERVHELFSNCDIWLALNRGELTQVEAMEAYRRDHAMSEQQVERFFAEVFACLELIEETPPLMRRLSAAGYRLFALSDNVREIVAHLRARDDFWQLFEGAVISAEVGVLKPNPAIYRHLLETHGLVAHETLFLDDVERNVAGAHSVGMHALLFTNAAQAERDLAELGIVLPEEEA